MITQKRRAGSDSRAHDVQAWDQDRAVGLGGGLLLSAVHRRRLWCSGMICKETERSQRPEDTFLLVVILMRADVIISRGHIRRLPEHIEASCSSLAGHGTDVRSITGSI